MGRVQALKVAKTVSLDLDLVNEILEESQMMSRDFSGTVTTLIRIGLSVRQDQRIREQESIRNASRNL